MAPPELIIAPKAKTVRRAAQRGAGRHWLRVHVRLAARIVALGAVTSFIVVQSLRDPRLATSKAAVVIYDLYNEIQSKLLDFYVESRMMKMMTMMREGRMKSKM